jgi:hypothetical protein
MNVMVLNRHLLVLVFQDFDPDLVGRGHECLIKAAIVAGYNRHARGLPPRHRFLDVLHQEADVVNDAADGSA